MRSQILTILIFAFFSFPEDTFSISTHHTSTSHAPSIDSTKNHSKKLTWHFSVPYVNNFALQIPDKGNISNTGFWGLSIGPYYNYNLKKFLSLKFSAASDLFVPVPASPGIDGEYESISSLFITLENNFFLKKKTVGYGINYSFNRWSVQDYDQTPRVTLEESKGHAFGASGNIYFPIFEPIWVGVFYRPTFFKIKPEVDFKYEHLISLDLTLRF